MSEIEAGIEALRALTADGGAAEGVQLAADSQVAAINLEQVSQTTKELYDEALTIPERPSVSDLLGIEAKAEHLEMLAAEAEVLVAHGETVLALLEGALDATSGETKEECQLLINMLKDEIADLKNVQLNISVMRDASSANGFSPVALGRMSPNDVLEYTDRVISSHHGMQSHAMGTAITLGSSTA